MAMSDFLCSCIIGYAFSLPDADPGTQQNLGQTQDLPASERDPFARDVLFDPGRSAMPRKTALLMLRSAQRTVSAPAKR